MREALSALERPKSDLSLSLTREENFSGGYELVVLEQGNLKASRKQLGAVMLEHLSESIADGSQA